MATWNHTFTGADGSTWNPDSFFSPVHYVGSSSAGADDRTVWSNRGRMRVGTTGTFPALRGYLFVDQPFNKALTVKCTIAVNTDGGANSVGANKGISLYGGDSTNHLVFRAQDYLDSKNNQQYRWVLSIFVSGTETLLLVNVQTINGAGASGDNTLQRLGLTYVSGPNYRHIFAFNGTTGAGLMHYRDTSTVLANFDANTSLSPTPIWRFGGAPLAANTYGQIDDLYSADVAEVPPYTTWTTALSVLITGSGIAATYTPPSESNFYAFGSGNLSVAGTGGLTAA